MFVDNVKGLVLEIMTKSSRVVWSTNAIEAALPQGLRVSEAKGGNAPSYRRKIISATLKADPVVFKKVEGGYRVL